MNKNDRGDCNGTQKPAGRAFLEIDWDAREQAWKFWVTSWYTLRGHTQRFKLLSKRLGDGTFWAIAIFQCQCEDHTKQELGEQTFPTTEKLEANARNTLRELARRFDSEMTVEEQDFTRCNTFEKWDYMMREGTVNRIETEEVT